MWLFSIVLLSFMVATLSLAEEGARRRLGFFDPGITMQSGNVPMKCKHADYPICCALVEDAASARHYPRREHNATRRRLHSDTHTHTERDTHSHSDTSSHNNEFSLLRGSAAQRALSSETHCHAVSTEYVPSALETLHIEAARRIAQTTDEGARLQQLKDFIAEDLEQTFKWLARVDFHLRDTRSSREKLRDPLHPDDLAYMSRFNTTLRCGPERTTLHWIEWIEPLTVHARHPCGLLNCGALTKFFPRRYKAWILDPGFVLVGSYQDYVHRSLLRRKSTRSHINHDNGAYRRPPQRYLFDSGSSTFNTNLAWITCAYLQRDMDFDKIIAWEYTQIPPDLYFQKLPPRMMPFVSFQNVPVAAGTQNATSVLRILRQIAQEQDFVSFKLDIDTPEVEIPIFLELLKSDEFAQYVDEFFFELHFKCEVMRSCGWGDTPAEVHGFQNDRVHAMLAFQTLRNKGVRAHFWP